MVQKKPKCSFWPTELFLEREREGEREGEKHQCVRETSMAASRTHPTGTLAHS